MGITHIYLIRHGESMGNKRDAFLGHTDLDLTPKGHMQAEQTAHYLKNIYADVIYSSDLMRAYSTAMHTAKIKGIDVIKNKNLREIFAGDWENKTFEFLKEEFADEYKIWMNNIGLARCTNGESVKELQNRIVNEVIKIAKENEGKTVFIFTHATPIRALKAACDNVKMDEMRNIPWATNASVTHAQYENSVLSIKDYSVDYFLGEIRTALPKNV